MPQRLILRVATSQQPWMICSLAILYFLVVYPTNKLCMKATTFHLLVEPNMYIDAFPLRPVRVSTSSSSSSTSSSSSSAAAAALRILLPTSTSTTTATKATTSRITSSNNNIRTTKTTKLNGWFTASRNENESPAPPQQQQSILQRSILQRQQRRRRRKQPSSQQQPSLTTQQKELLQKYPITEIGACVGAGSYGTVHYVYIQPEDVDPSTSTITTVSDSTDDTNDITSINNRRVLIGKRPWTLQELQDKYQQNADNVVNNDELLDLKDKSIRCQYYYNVEKHCSNKMRTNPIPSSPFVVELLQQCNYNNNQNANLLLEKEAEESTATTTPPPPPLQQQSLPLLVPQFVGTGMDMEQREWILFEPLYAPPPLELITPILLLNNEGNENENEDEEEEASDTSIIDNIDVENTFNRDNQNGIKTDNGNMISLSPPPLLTSLLALDVTDTLNDNNINDTNDNDSDDEDDYVTEMIAFSLQEIMEVDRIKWEQQQQDVMNGSGTPTNAPPQQQPQQKQYPHHLYCTSQALLGLDKEHSLVETLDVIMEQLLQILVYIHSYSIVHRDVKPANLLITKPLDDITTTAANNIITTPSRLILIDFGSAGDLSTAGLLKENIGLDMNRVAISPIYAAPEIFLDSIGGGGTKYAANFDCFSVALLYCQLLFQYLDERTESGFHQQLANQNVPWDLDSWLQSAIQSKVRPVGLADALQVLSERPGLWKLLQDMLQPNPSERLSSTDALIRWNKIRTNALQKSTTTTVLSDDDRNERIDPDLFDGPYLLDVLESLETCEIPTIRPLHFVTSFDRSTSLGLYLAEADGVDISSMDETIQEQWQRATADAGSGEVFVQDIIPGGQADKMGIFAIGDRLQGVGELPLAGGGFERATELIQDQPKSAEFVTLQFDRKSVLVTDIPTDTDTLSTTVSDMPTIKKVDQGAWSVKGRRQVQEDAFILHEVLDTKDKSVILAGVFDGHLGSAASDFCRDDLPVAFAAAMNVGTSDDIDNDGNIISDNDSNTVMKPSTVQSYLELAWNECCESYRSMCEITDAECIAEYDPKEGILQAKTGSQTAVAGTTAMVFAFDQLSNQLATLNCGDSRGIVLNGNNELIFQTTDHRPDVELERLTEMGNPPKCDIARWTIAVNNYDYSVSRSLEGYLATSKGIISDADVTLLTAQPGMTVIAATDGLWDTIDTAEVMQVVTQLRQIKSSAGDIAKALCSLAYEKGSSDNISVVALCLE